MCSTRRSRANLRLARRDATEEQLRDALDGARLLAWVDALPEGMDTEVGEHGGRISGGERQRLAAARALLADFPVLVLDEPGEHLDAETGDAIVADVLDASRRAGGAADHPPAGGARGRRRGDRARRRACGRSAGRTRSCCAAGGRYAEMWRREQGAAMNWAGPIPDRPVRPRQPVGAAAARGGHRRGARVRRRDHRRVTAPADQPHVLRHRRRARCWRRSSARRRR